MTSTAEYIYDHVTRNVLMEDMSFSEDAPRPGERLPEFDLPTTDGGRIRSGDFSGKKPLLLITGSYSCPMTASSNPILKRLYQEFGADIEFLLLHVREAHPGEHRQQPRNISEKMEHARALQRRDRLPWPIAVDDTNGTVHRALDEKPNAVYLTDKRGVIVYRGLWAGDETGLAPALRCVAEGCTPRQQDSQRRFNAMAMGVGKMQEMVRQSGPRAEWDLWRSAPPMAAVAWLADLYSPLPPKWRTVAAVATIGVGLSVFISFLAKGRRA